MPLIEHLRELRRRIFISALAILLGSTLGFYFYSEIITLLASPVCDLNSLELDRCGTLTINGILGPLNLQLKVALLSGVILAAPIWLYQLWAFIAPALHRREKKGAIAFILAATPFFFAGATLGYLTLPAAIHFLMGLTPENLTLLVGFDLYLEFVLRIILVFALAFELPVFLVALNLIGVLSGRTILKPWRGWVFAIALFVASFSPSADPISLIVLTLPLVAFYFIAGAISLLNDRRRSKRGDSQFAADGSVLPATSIDNSTPLEGDS